MNELSNFQIVFKPVCAVLWPVRNCASACLKEEHLEMMRKCIQRCLDCADICQLCARMEQKAVCIHA